MACIPIGYPRPPDRFLDHRIEFEKAATKHDHVTFLLYEKIATSTLVFRRYLPHYPIRNEKRN